MPNAPLAETLWHSAVPRRPSRLDPAATALVLVDLQRLVVARAWAGSAASAPSG
jgi:hypothetical protein